MNTTVVIPTIREESIKRFLEEWKFDARVIVVEDNPTKTFKLKGVEHYAWNDIEKDLGKDAWIIPRRTDAVRNYGFILASREDCDMVVTLDDDCYPWHASSRPNHLLESHWKALETPGTGLNAFDTMFALGLAVKPRGFPKETLESETVLNHGLWNNVPDLDGETQLKTGNISVTFQDHSIQVPREILFPMCGMNVAFRPYILPLMYYWPMGQGQPYNRFADIWCGLVMKTVCDYFGMSIRSGSPFVNHSRASDAAKNASLEAPGLRINDELWTICASALLESDTVSGAFLELIQRICDHMSGKYWDDLKEASHLWVKHLS